MKKYLVIFEKTSTGYSAYVPDLPGCVVTAKDRAHAESEISEAIQFHIEGLREQGLQIPDAVSEPEMMLVAIS